MKVLLEAPGRGGRWRRDRLPRSQGARPEAPAALRARRVAPRPRRDAYIRARRSSGPCKPPLHRLAEAPDEPLSEVDLPGGVGGDGPVTEAAKRLAEADGLAALFALAKELVDEHLDRSRVGIMVGLQSLGLSPNGYLGGYYVAGSNAIVLNRDVLAHVETTRPELSNAYAFHVILHEYLHALGLFDEATVRENTLEVCRQALGPEHPATRIAATMAPGRRAGEAPELFRELTLPPYGWEPDDGGRIEYVRGVDRDATSYIA